MRARRFDAAVLLTNSVRSAFVTWAGRVRRRIGYARDGRSLFLTDRLHALRENGRFVPSPMVDYYNAIAEAAGCETPDRSLHLGISDEQERVAAELRAHYELESGRYAVINPGAAFGAAKCWLPERFAAVCDELQRRWSITPVIVGAPGEAPLMRHIADHCETAAICCIDPGTTLGTLKGLIRDAAIVVCNDTGPRHYGVALRVPTVTIFGPTHQEWTITDYTGEIALQIPVECGPCMLRTCPIDHRCMTGVTVEMVMRAVDQHMASGSAPAYHAAGKVSGQAAR
jgi:heptosyltransferase-2